MKNKVLVEIIVPNIEEKYDIYIPVNKKIGNLISLLSKTINELTGGYYQNEEYRTLYNGLTGEYYNTNALIRETDIRNGSKLILM